MRMKYIITILLLSLPAFSHVYARHNAVHPTDTVAPIVKAYTDSLLRYRARLDSVMLTDSIRSFDNVNTADGNYSPLFLPLTFYHGIVHQVRPQRC